MGTPRGASLGIHPPPYLPPAAGAGGTRLKRPLVNVGAGILLASPGEPAASCPASPRAVTPGRALPPSSLSPHPMILASRQSGCKGDRSPLDTPGITHSVKSTLASPGGQWRMGVGHWKGEEGDGVSRGTTPTLSGMVIQ